MRPQAFRIRRPQARSVSHWILNFRQLTSRSRLTDSLSRLKGAPPCGRRSPITGRVLSLWKCRFALRRFRSPTGTEESEWYVDESRFLILFLPPRQEAARRPFLSSVCLLCFHDFLGIPLKS